MGGSSAGEESSGAITVAAENSGVPQSQPSGAGAESQDDCQIIGVREKRADRAQIQRWHVGRLPCGPNRGRHYRESN